MHLLVGIRVPGIHAIPVAREQLADVVVRLAGDLVEETARIDESAVGGEGADAIECWLG